MSNQVFKIKSAEKYEINKALTLLKDAAIWLKKQNIDHWQNWINPSKEDIKWIEEGFNLGQFYFVYQSSNIIGMYRLQWSDEKFWGIKEDNSGYFHSLTTVRKYYGNGFGQKIVSMIEDICKKQNKKYLRLDCDANNQKLCDYYEKLGFILVGETKVNDYNIRLYEKELNNNATQHCI